MTLDLTGEPFPAGDLVDQAKAKPAAPACAECASGALGLYNFKCRRCEARAYVRAPEVHQKAARKRWKETLDAAGIAEMQRMVAEERAKEQQRKAGRGK
jgi:cytochrome c5